MAPNPKQVGSCKLALLFELSDELSKERMAAQGKQEEIVQRKLRNFATQTLPIAQAPAPLAACAQPAHSLRMRVHDMRIVCA